MFFRVVIRRSRRIFEGKIVKKLVVLSKSRERGILTTRSVSTPKVKEFTYTIGLNHY